MMRVLTFLAVFGFAASAYGVTIGMQFGPGTTGDVGPGGDTVTLRASDVAAIEIWAFDLSSGLAFFGFGIDIVPPLGDPPDFTFEGAVGGPTTGGYFYYGPNFPQFVDGQAYPYLYYHEMEVLLATFYFHCTGEPSEHDIVTYDFGGAAFVTNPNTGDYQGVGFDSSLHISQVPEPASLALLALGGLALIRRR